MMLDGFLTEIFSKGAFLGMPSWLVFMVFIFMEVILCYGTWKVLAKAGRVPWHGIVPFLHHLELYDIAWNRKVGILVIILRLTELFIGPYGRNLDPYGWSLRVYIPVFILHFALSAIMKIKLSRSFGKSMTFAFCMIFMNELCMFLLGVQKCEYLGRTLYRRDNSSHERTRVQKERDLIIQLYRFRSVIALAASVCVVVFTFRAVVGGLITNPNEVTPERGANLYKLFTVNSNTLSALGAAFLVPYAIEGVRRRRFSFPKWVLLVQYSGTICTTLTMIFALTLIWPVLGSLAVTGMNFWLHIVCPILAIVLLMSVESDNIRLTPGDSLLCLLPFYLYALVYISNVLLLGEQHGGWRDIYRLITYFPAFLTTPIMFLLGLSVAALLRIGYNKLSDFRHKRMVESWPDDADPTEIKISVFGVGYQTGLHSEESNIVVPMDLFDTLSEKYDLSTHELNRAYITGAEGGMRQRRQILQERLEWFSMLFGIPDKIYNEEAAFTDKEPEEETGMIEKE